MTTPGVYHVPAARPRARARARRARHEPEGGRSLLDARPRAIARRPGRASPDPLSRGPANLREDPHRRPREGAGRPLRQRVFHWALAARQRAAAAPTAAGPSRSGRRLQVRLADRLVLLEDPRRSSDPRIAGRCRARRRSAPTWSTSSTPAASRARGLRHDRDLRGSDAQHPTRRVAPGTVGSALPGDRNEDRERRRGPDARAERRPGLLQGPGPRPRRCSTPDGWLCSGDLGDDR